MIPSEHKLVLQVFDENRLTRDDFLGLIELQLLSLPKEADTRTIPPKKMNLQPRSPRSKVKGHLNIYAAFIPDPLETPEETNGTTESNGNSVPEPEDGAVASSSSSQPPSAPATAASSSDRFDIQSEYF